MIRLMHRENGQAIVLVALFMLGLVALAGLVADGGLVFAQRRDLQNLADSAAAAAAMEIDIAAYRASGGSSVVLEQRSGRLAALQHLTSAHGLSYAVAVQPRRAEVHVSRNASTGFLRLLGIQGVPIEASAQAEPRYGVAGAGP